MTSSSNRKDPARWENRYAAGDTPWNRDEHDPYLAHVLERYAIVPQAMLEIGCGTGTNAIWLGQKGFTVRATDVSATAIGEAQRKARASQVDCTFLVENILEAPPTKETYGFIYDRAVFHIFDEEEDRKVFVKRVYDHLQPGGLWHCLIGSTDGPPRDSGPPRRSATEIVRVVEPHFEILELTSTTFDGDLHEHARAFIMVARRRGPSA